MTFQPTVRHFSALRPLRITGRTPFVTVFLHFGSIKQILFNLNVDYVYKVFLNFNIYFLLSNLSKFMILLKWIGPRELMGQLVVSIFSS